MGNFGIGIFVGFLITISLGRMFPVVGNLFGGVLGIGGLIGGVITKKR